MVIEVFLTIDPGKEFSRDILQFPLIKGIRLNTGAPIIMSETKVIKHFKTSIYPIEPWIDLKGRELRLIKDATIPKDYLELNHEIEVNTPTAIYYNEGKDFLVIDELMDGTKLKVRTPDNFQADQFIQFGKGTSINIPDESLNVKGYFTDNDLEYIEAARENDIHNYLLSFVERLDDVEELLNLDPEANLHLKIESKKGLEFVKKNYSKINQKVRLVAARADLYIELNHPHEIIEALRIVIKADPDAIVASHLLESFIDLEKIPRCTDFTDIGYLTELGYKSFLFGDDICQKSESLSSALGVFKALFL